MSALESVIGGAASGPRIDQRPAWQALWRGRLAWPLLILLAAFYAWPLVHILLMSFGAPDFTTASYGRVFAVPAYGLVMMNTLWISGLVTAICLVLGYPVALVLATVSPQVARLLMVFVIVPFGTSLLVRNYAWMVILGNNGLINTLLKSLGLVDQPLPLLYNTFGAVVGMSHVLLPYMVLVLLASMRGIDRALGLAAHSLGAGPLRAFTTIFLPLSAPGIVAGSVLVFIMSLGFFITPALLGGRSGTMISMVIEAQINQLVNWPLGAALSILLLVVTFLLLGVGAWLAFWRRTWRSR
jgi:putative spermidine/putrescine transport system permease protein